jgi:hypothetical protein
MSKSVLKNMSSKSIKEVDRTKKFLFENCYGNPTFDKMKEFVDKRFFKLWVAGGKVSKIYVILSPWINNIMNVEDFWTEISVDPLLIKEKITDEIKEYFKHEFLYEF